MTPCPSDADIENHSENCGGGPCNRTAKPTIPDYFIESEITRLSRSCLNTAESESSVKVSPELQSEVPFGNNDETRNRILVLFPNKSNFEVEIVLNNASSWDEAVDMMTPASTSIKDVIKCFVKEKKNKNQHTILPVNRDTLWRDVIRFYKISMMDTSVLFKKLIIQFTNEEGVDAGALTVEFFNKFFEIAKKELFEAVPSGKYFLPKRSGGNLTLFKMIGVAIGHSILNGGPTFPCFPEWCYAILSNNSDEEMVGLLANNRFEEVIPLHAGTATVFKTVRNCQV